MRPNAHTREARRLERQIRTLSEPAASRAVTPASAEATLSVGGIDAGGDFASYGRIGIDRLAEFRVAE